MGTPLPSHRSISIVADGRLGGCDRAHWPFVREKVVVRSRYGVLRISGDCGRPVQPEG